jgi:hypothetical protein
MNHIYIFLLILYCALHVVDGFQNHLVPQDSSTSSLHGSLLNYNSVIELESSADVAKSKPAPHIAIPGGGIYFYWQAGVITFLREQSYDLSQCTYTGASAGALTATLGIANVDFYDATKLALSLAEDAGVWDRKGGLQGIWGPMIEEWLQALIPSSSVDNLKGRLSILVTPLPSFGKDKVSDFQSKSDLVQCNMASVHLPWFLDGRLTCDFRGNPHIDGSFLAQPGDFLPSNRNANDDSVLVLDWHEDPVLGSKGGFDIVEALSPGGIYSLLEYGRTHAKRMEEEGKFASLEKI